MNDPFKSENYKKNLDSLIEAIKLKKIGEQYNKTLRDLSQALESFTDKAEDVAKFAIYTDLNNYVEPVNKKPSGLFGTLREAFNRILGKDVPIKNSDLRNFANDKLFSLTTKVALEYLNVSKKISDLEQSKKNQEEHRLYRVNLEDRTASKQEENPLYAPQEGDSGYGSLLDEGSEYEEISNYQEKKSKILVENSQSSKSPKEEPIYATVSKKHIEAKRERKQKQQSKPPILPKPSIAPPISEKMFTTGQEVRQEPKVVAKDKPTVPLKPQNLGQKVSTKPKVVGKKSAESKPIVPLKSENQNNRQSAQKAAGAKVAAVTIKKGVNREIGSKIKALKEKFEQNQAKGNANVQLAESKTTPAAQADIVVKKNPSKAASQSHSFPTGNKRSAILTAKSDLKPHNPPSTQVSVKEMVAQIEKGKGGR